MRRAGARGLNTRNRLGRRFAVADRLAEDDDAWDLDRNANKVDPTRGLGLAFQSFNEAQNGFRGGIRGALFITYLLEMPMGSVKREVDIKVAGVCPVHQVTEKIAETGRMVASCLLAESANGFVGPVGAVEIRNHMIPFPLMSPPQRGLDGEELSGGESSERKGEGAEGNRPAARSAASEGGDTEAEGTALALEREVRH